MARTSLCFLGLRLYFKLQMPKNRLYFKLQMPKNALLLSAFPTIHDLDQREAVVRVKAANVKTADVLLTGLAGLDRIVRLAAGTLTEIAGASGSGKTQVNFRLMEAYIL